MRVRIRLLAIGVLALTIASCGKGGTASIHDPFPKVPRSIQLTSPAFGEGDPIPKKYTCDGENISPPLSWTGVPEKAVALVLICEDPDAPFGTFTHWVLTGLTPDDKGLLEHLPQEELLATGDWKDRPQPPRQGKNDFGNPGYGGPCPPAGTHRYVFRLFSLDAQVEIAPGAGRKDVLRAIEGHVLAQGRLIGRYTRAK